MFKLIMGKLSKISFIQNARKLQTCHVSVIQGYLFLKPALLWLLWRICLYVVVNTDCILSMLY